MEYSVAALTPDTWPLFVALAEKHNGVWGGCWCAWFHAPKREREASGEDNRTLKQRWVEDGTAHAALVVTDGAAIAWCQYGRLDELPCIKHQKEYEAGPPAPADYRITCFFVDRDHRRQGVAEIALQGALDLIALDGGGVVESFPHDVDGKKTSSSFLHNGTRTLFERAGFTYERPLGMSRTVMHRTVAGRSGS